MKIPTPSPHQLAWHEMEFCGFVHFSINTFTDREWGEGDEAEELFHPTNLDARQWASVARKAGMKGLILTAKHHDGFCLWPSRYTAYSIARSPWRNGQGDVVREVADACHECGLKFGIYLSPWDRHHAEYGRSGYTTYYHNQLRELLTNYGEIFAVWLDGANGGAGYYGGAREKRTIDARQYYDCPTIISIVRQLQPHAVICSDAGPDVRWVGNESGVAGQTCWATLNRDEFHLGTPRFAELAVGQRAGRDWVPAEADVSLRPGWFYHPQEDHKVKSPDQLLDIYYSSIGRGANLLLNLSPDRSGRIHDYDTQVLSEFRYRLDGIFSANLAHGKPATASNTHGRNPQFGPSSALDGNRTTYWGTDDGMTTPDMVVDLGQPTIFNRVRIREFIALGQRVEAFTVDFWSDSGWGQLSDGTSIGPQKILRTPTVTTDRVRLRIVRASACPAISEFGLFLDPRTAEPSTQREDSCNDP